MEQRRSISDLDQFDWALYPLSKEMATTLSLARWPLRHRSLHTMRVWHPNTKFAYEAPELWDAV